MDVKWSEKRDRVRTTLAYALAGVFAGIVFGLYGGRPMMEMVGMMIRSDATGGWALHLLISAFYGAAYGEAVQRIRPTAISQPMMGLAYGVVLWLVGPLLLMPLFLGMPQIVGNVAANVPSLYGHMIYGAVLQAFGQVAVFAWSASRGAKPQSRGTTPAG